MYHLVKNSQLNYQRGRNTTYGAIINDHYKMTCCYIQIIEKIYYQIYQEGSSLVLVSFACGC